MKNGKSCYVEIEGYAANWLRNLISRGLVADGVVIERSIVDVTPRELAEFSQVHLYAGIGVWSYSLRRAGIPDNANVWTFSEPCQPFSAAGKGLGFADDRYLRPYTNHLVEQCRPSICLGEQVASNDGLGWLDVVQTDFERARYACGAIDTCSASVGAPHIRQRLRVCAVAEEWLGDANNSDQFGDNGSGRKGIQTRDERRRWSVQTDSAGSLGRLVHAERTGLEGLGRYVGDRNQSGRFGADQAGHAAASSDAGGLADNDHNRLAPPPVTGIHNVQHHVEPCSGTERLADAFMQQRSDGKPRISIEHHEGRWNEGAAKIAGLRRNSRPNATNGFWSNCDWLFCRDGKWRPVEPGTFPLAHGASFKLGSGGTLEGKSRVGMLRAYGNAVDAEATTQFCRSVGEVLGLIR